MAELSLEIVEGPAAGRLVPLTGVLEIGRNPGAGLRVDDEHVFGLHARVTLEGDGALVEDLGDPGGTFVNDAELHAPTRIKPGDVIQVGVTVLKLRSAEEIAAQPSAARPKPPPPAVTEPEPQYVSPELPEVEALLDVRTKTKARHAPLAVFVVVVYAVLIYLATQRL